LEHMGLAYLVRLSVFPFFDILMFGSQVSAIQDRETPFGTTSFLQRLGKFD